MKRTNLDTLLQRLIHVDWKRDKSAMDTIASSIGLTDREPDSNWVHFSVPGTLLRPGYLAEGREVRRFSIYSDAFDVGDFVDEDDFNGILEKQYALFTGKFEKLAARIAKVFEVPSFQGGQDDAGYEKLQPDLWGAMRIAVWPVKNARLVLTCDHADKELPIILELFLLPLEPVL